MGYGWKFAIYSLIHWRFDNDQSFKVKFIEALEINILLLNDFSCWEHDFFINTCTCLICKNLLLKIHLSCLFDWIRTSKISWLNDPIKVSFLSVIFGALKIVFEFFHITIAIQTVVFQENSFKILVFCSFFKKSLKNQPIFHHKKFKTITYKASICQTS